MAKLRNILSNEPKRARWVEARLSELPTGALLLDAGCGSQQYRTYCGHLTYRAQDFGQYTADVTDGFASGLGGQDGYQYGALDYIGDIWTINESDASFDAILCTEVFEHIPYPIETISEFARLLRSDGTLILTLPSNCLRHMDPFFFYSGFSDRFLEKFLGEAGFDIQSIEAVGDYYSWIAAEIARTMKNHGVVARAILAPALAWYMRQKPTAISTRTLCMGYHVVAKRRKD